MLIYLAIIYAVYRIVRFLYVHKGQSKEVLAKMTGFLILEIALVITGIITIAPALFGGGSNSPTLTGAMLVFGAISLIISGRVGMYVRKLGKSSAAELVSASAVINKQLTITKVLTTVSFIGLILAWPFYEGSFRAWAALIYVAVLICATLAIRYASKSKSSQDTNRVVVWGLIVIASIIALLSTFMILGIIIKV